MSGSSVRDETERILRNTERLRKTERQYLDSSAETSNGRQYLGRNDEIHCPEDIICLDSSAEARNKRQYLDSSAEARNKRQYLDSSVEARNERQHLGRTHTYIYLDRSAEASPSKKRRKGKDILTKRTGSGGEACQIMDDNSDNILRVKNTHKEMCDVFFLVGNKEYGAHKLILCASSDVFQVMLMRQEWSECRENKVQLQEMSICEPVFPIFLEYFYTGKIMITHTNVMPILVLADKYIVKGLMRTCLDYMCKHVPHAAHHNQLISWLQYIQYSMACGTNKVLEKCQNYIKWNFETFADTPDFSNFDIDMFVKIIEQSDIVVHSEMVLFNCVVRWLDLQHVKLQQQSTTSQNIEFEFKLMVKKIMKYVRFPRMTARELAALQLYTIFKEHKECFFDRLAIGVNYHSGRVDVLQSRFEVEGYSLLTPRVYTSDSCSALLTIEDFHSVPKYHSSNFVFASYLSAPEHKSHKINAWIVDLYPKGVCFKKCFLKFGELRTIEVPGKIINTFRLSLTCREVFEPNMRVKISVLIYGQQGGLEHVMEVREIIHHLSPKERTVNIDNLIPFNELNRRAGLQEHEETLYLVGPNRDKLKLNLVIAPIR